MVREKVMGIGKKAKDSTKEENYKTNILLVMRQNTK